MSGMPDALSYQQSAINGDYHPWDEGSPSNMPLPEPARQDSETTDMIGFPPGLSSYDSSRILQREWAEEGRGHSAHLSYGQAI